MKAKILSMSVFLLILFSITMVGCSGSGNSSSTISSKISDTSVPASPSSASLDSKSASTTSVPSDSSVLEAYKAVLQNKTEFYSTDNKKKLYLNDFLSNKELYNIAFKITHFTVLDMDGDKVPEVVLELSVNDEPEFYEVLHDIDGTVYGYIIVYRGLEELKADGTFLFSGGAADNGWGKLKFESNAYETEKLGYSQSSQGDTGLTISYFIQDQPVTKEAFDSFMNEQSAKKDTVWYEFSQDNIETELSVNS